ncbi:unnamed protein product [Moneuplotes crassus]|uniref:Uncharacterized protein n=1 Tax=Euplotes crassus TaxID=5936 RepID=A0AAD1UM35_EUPCR|nr:unnamed protein product [Moneuplotes crassus]
MTHPLEKQGETIGLVLCLWYLMDFQVHLEFSSETRCNHPQWCPDIPHIQSQVLLLFLCHSSASNHLAGPSHECCNRVCSK